MKISTLIAAVALTLAPSFAAAMCGDHSVTMSCAEGQVYDSESRSCVPSTTG